MAKRCGPYGCPRTDWWKDTLGTNYYTGGGGVYVSQSGSGGDGSQGNPYSPAEFETALGDGTIKAGETVKFKRGDTFEMGDVTVFTSGLTFDAYGSGDDPIFIGSTDISSGTWTDEGGGLYSTPMATAPKWIFKNGVAAKRAQTAWIAKVSVPDSTHFEVDPSDLSGFSTIIGSKARIIQSHYQISNELEVTAYDNVTGILTLSPAFTVDYNGYIALLDQLDFIDENDEWYYDSAAQKLYYKAAANPTTLSLRACTHDNAITLSGVTSFTIQNIKITEYNLRGIKAANDQADNVTIQNCEFTDIKQLAVDLGNAQGCQLLNNTLNRIGVSGLSVVCEGTNSNATISGNDIQNIGMDSNYPFRDSGGRQGIGIICTGSGSLITYNYIYNTAYNGILMNGAGDDDSVCQYNEVDQFLNRLRDGGGLYTSGNPVTYPNKNIKFLDNIVGNVNPSAEGSLVSTEAYGIYLDNRTINSLAQRNTVYNIPYIGIMTNFNTEDNSILDNTVYNCNTGVRFRHSSTPTAPVVSTACDGHTFTGNIIVQGAGSLTGIPVSVLSLSINNYDPWANGGLADSNIFIQPFQTYIGQYQFSGSTTYDLAGWKTRFSQDAASSAQNSILKTAGNIARNIQLITNPANSALSGSADLDGTYKDVNGSTITNYSIAAYQSLLLLAQKSSEYSINIDSGDYIDAPSTADVQFERTDPFTISFWIKIPSTHSTSQAVFDTIASGGAGRGIRGAVLSTNIIQFELRNTVSTNRYTITTNNSFADDIWHHVLFVKPATFADSSIYVDGVLQGVSEANNLTATIISTGNLALGGPNFGQGWVDEFAIWNSDQGANIAEIFNGGMTRDLTKLSTPPLHYWKIENGDYNDYGSSAIALNGSEVGTPTASTDVP